MIWEKKIDIIKERLKLMGFVQTWRREPNTCYDSGLYDWDWSWSARESCSGWSPEQNIDGPNHYLSRGSQVLLACYRRAYYRVFVILPPPCRRQVFFSCQERCCNGEFTSKYIKKSLRQVRATRAIMAWRFMQTGPGPGGSGKKQLRLEGPPCLRNFSLFLYAKITI